MSQAVMAELKHKTSNCLVGLAMAHSQVDGWLM